MKDTVLTLIAMMFLFSFEIPAASIEESIGLDCEVSHEFYLLWAESWFGRDATREKSAWVIQNSQGRFQWIRWPSTRQWKKELWKGEIPKNLVAQVHTHPLNTDPKPSFNDLVFSRKVNIPVYTVSRHGIWKINPDGSIEVVGGSNWHTRCNLPEENYLIAKIERR